MTTRFACPDQSRRSFPRAGSPAARLQRWNGRTPRRGRMLMLSLFIATVASAAAVHASDPPITAVAFAPNGEMVVAVSQSGLHVFTWPDLQRQETIETSASNLHCLAFSPKGDRLAIGGGHPSVEGIVEVFSWPAVQSIAVMNDHDDSVLAIVWQDESKLLTASLDREIKRFDLHTRSSLVTYKGHSRGVTSLCLLNDHKTLVSAGDDQSVRVWDVESGELVRSLSQHTASVHAAALRPVSGRGGLPMVASAAGDRTIRFWQPTIGRLVRFVRLETEPLSIRWLSKGSRIVASCVDGCVYVIDPDNVKVVHQQSAIDGWAYAIAVHPSNRSVAVGGAGGQIQRVELQP